MEKFEVVIKPEEILRTLSILSLSFKDPAIFSRSKYAIKACKSVAKIYGRNKLIKLQYTGALFLPVLILNREESFYFNCLRDSDCCLRREVSVLPEEFERISSFLDLDKKQTFKQYFKINNDILVIKHNQKEDCIFLNRNLNSCKIYPVRPGVCRKYPMLYTDKKSVEIELCPGCFGGKKIKVEDWIKENKIDDFSAKVRKYEDSFISYSSNLEKHGLFEPDLKQVVLKLYNII